MSSARCLPISLDTIDHICYCCHTRQDDAHIMFACPTCSEFICEGNDACDGRCRCELLLHFNAINDENIGQFGSTPAAWIKDEDSRYVAMSEEYERVFDAQIGYTDHDLFGKEIGDRLRSQDLEILETGNAIEQVNEVATETGKRYWLVKKAMISAKGKRFIAGTGRDITDLVLKAGLMCGLLISGSLGMLAQHPQFHGRRRLAIHYHVVTLEN